MALYNSQKMKELIKIIASIALLTLISLSLQKIFFQPKDLPNSTQLQDLGPLPQAKGRTIDGTILSLPLPQPTLIVFWAQWCPLCLNELPDLNHIQKKYAEEGLKVVMINIDKKEDRALAQKIWQKGQYSPIALFSISKSFLQQVPVRALPHHVFVDKNGIQRLTVPGIINWRGPKVTNLIEKLLRP